MRNAKCAQAEQKGGTQMQTGSDPLHSKSLQNPRPILELIHSLLPPEEREKIELSSERPKEERRKSLRLDCAMPAKWDFFTLGRGIQKARIQNLSTGGCLLELNQSIELRRWIRLVIQHDPLDFISQALPLANHSPVA